MNGKFEERLARLAFGDLTPEETQRLEREALGNPDAARVLMEYSAMRDGLRSLGADVPADQLSKERLRDAILGQGLRPVAPEPTRPVWNWLWMPTVACAIAFGIVTVRNNMPAQGGQEPMIVMDDAKTDPFEANLTPPSTVADLMPAPQPEKVEKVVEVAKKPVVTLAKNTPPAEAPRRPRRKSRKAPAVDLGLLAKADLETAPDSVLLSPKKDPAPVPVAQKEEKPDAVVTLASAPIVLIDTGKNAETGASNAMEVGDPNHVLVGG
jgi:hypothetical protein